MSRCIARTEGVGVEGAISECQQSKDRHTRGYARLVSLKCPSFSELLQYVSCDAVFITCLRKERKGVAQPRQGEGKESHRSEMPGLHSTRGIPSLSFLLSMATIFSFPLHVSKREVCEEGGDHVYIFSKLPNAINHTRCLKEEPRFHHQMRIF